MVQRPSIPPLRIRDAGRDPRHDRMDPRTRPSQPSGRSLFRPLLHHRWRIHHDADPGGVEHEQFGHGLQTRHRLRLPNRRRQLRRPRLLERVHLDRSAQIPYGIRRRLHPQCVSGGLLHRFVLWLEG